MALIAALHQAGKLGPNLQHPDTSDLALEASTALQSGRYKNEGSPWELIHVGEQDPTSHHAPHPYPSLSKRRVRKISLSMSLALSLALP